MLFAPVNIAIVVIVTERFKEEMLAELKRALDEVEKLINQVKSRKMVKVSEVLKGTIIDHISEQAKEQTRREDRERRALEEDEEYKLEYLKILKSRLLKEMENVKTWQEGEEVLFKTLTGMTIIQPGVNIKESMSTIVVKVRDWVVVSISAPKIISKLPEKGMQ